MTIDNRTKKPLKIVCVKLIQQTRFHGTSRTENVYTPNKKRVENREVASVVYTEKIEAGQEVNWKGELKNFSIFSDIPKTRERFGFLPEIFAEAEGLYRRSRSKTRL